MAGGREDDRPGREDDLGLDGREVDRTAVGGRREVDRRGALELDCFFLAALSGMTYGYCVGIQPEP